MSIYRLQQTLDRTGHIRPYFPAENASEGGMINSSLLESDRALQATSYAYSTSPVLTRQEYSLYLEQSCRMVYYGIPPVRKIGDFA